MAPALSRDRPAVDAASRPTRAEWVLPLPRGRALALGGPTQVMGVVNLTPDSFSDGGRWLEPARAVQHALALLEAGATVLDLGAESTRPGGGVYGAGAPEVSAAEEIDRLLPVLEILRRETDRPLSVDTRKAAVARVALAAGADLVNDVTALGDPEMAAVVAQSGVAVVLMHARGTTATMQRHAVYEDVVAEVRDELAAALDRAEAAGIDRELTVVDPGIGFAKTARHNLALLRNLPALGALGRPLLVGASRKSFLGEIVGGAAPDDRLEGSLAAAAWAAAGGAALVRVHDVRETARFLAAWAAIAEAAR